MADIKANQIAKSIDNNYFVEIFILNALQIANKQVQLANTPSDPLKVTIDAVGGTSQKNPEDFIVTGDIVDWDGRGLETILTVGETIRVIYIL